MQDSNGKPRAKSAQDYVEGVTCNVVGENSGVVRPKHLDDYDLKYGAAYAVDEPVTVEEAPDESMWRNVPWKKNWKRIVSTEHVGWWSCPRGGRMEIGLQGEEKLRNREIQGQSGSPRICAAIWSRRYW